VKHKIYIRTLSALFISLALVACGGNGKTTNQGSSENSQQSSSASDSSSIEFVGRRSITELEPGMELADVQILHRGNGADVQTLDPHKAEGVPSSHVLRDLYEGLTSEAPNGDVIPGGAESWTISEDGTVYTFNIREAQWSNGDPVTATDFEYGLKRSADPLTLSKYSYILAPIKNAEDVAAGNLPLDDLGVKALDDRTLEITLRAPTPYFLGLLNHSSTYPAHRASIEQYEGKFARPGRMVTNGAYKLTESVPQSHIKLERNELYWDNENTIIDTVMFYPTEDQSSELKRFRADELDYTNELPYKQLGFLKENYADSLVLAPYLGVYYYGFNLTREPFEDNLALRKALSLAIDRDIITQKVTGAGETPAYSWIPKIRGYSQQVPEYANWTQAERVAEAKRLYAEAGYGPDKSLTVDLYYNTSENHKRVATAISQMLKQNLGVNVELLNQEWKVFLETRKQKKDTQLFRAGWIGDYEDPYTFAELMLTTSGLNDSAYIKPEYDALLEKAYKEPDVEERRKILEEAERMLIADAPVMPIYHYATKRLVKPYVGGFQPNIMDHHYSKNMFIIKH